MRPWLWVGIVCATTSCTWIDDAAYTERIDQDGDGVLGSEDCDDSDASVFPGADEVADDGIDQDCSGADATQCWTDGDGDGVGGGFSVVADACTDGLVRTTGDCDDADATTFPGTDERCDDIDHDCDGDPGTELATITLADGRSLPLATDDQLPDDATRVDFCGGTWALDVAWAPTGEDLALVANPAHPRPVLRGTITGSGEGRSSLLLEYLQLDAPDPTATIVRVDGHIVQRPSVTLDDVLVDNVDAVAVVATTDAEVRLEDVFVRDSRFGSAAVDLTRGSFTMVAGEVARCTRTASTDVPGGLVQADGTFVEVFLANFENNQGRALSFEHTSATVFDVDFVDNYHPATDAAIDGGGALYVMGGTTVLTDNLFRGNGTTGLGGAVLAVDADVVLYDTTFEANGPEPVWSGGPHLTGAGGAITTFNGTLFGQNAVFRNNQAIVGGGAIAGYGDVALVGAELMGNHVLTSDAEGAELGGHALLQGDAVLQLVDVTIGGFPPLTEGACVRAADTEFVTLDQVVVEDCPVRCVHLDRVGRTLLDDLTAEGCVDPDGRGGAALLSDGTPLDGSVDTSQLLIVNSHFAGALAAGPGGALRATAGAVTSVNNRYTDNLATTGGGLHITAPVFTTCADQVQDNVAQLGAGGLYVAGELLAVTLEPDCATPTQVLGNATYGDGGGILVDGSFYATSLLVEGNAAGGDGGGIHAHGELGLTEGVSLVGNYAGGRGGGLTLDYLPDTSELQLPDDVAPRPYIGAVSIVDNIATTGGGVVLSGSGWVDDVRAAPVFDGTNLERNTAYDAAALYIDPMSSLIAQGDDIYEQSDRIDGSVVLTGHVGPTAVVRGGRTGRWSLTVDADADAVLVDGSGACVLPTGVSTTSCDPGAPCSCP